MYSQWSASSSPDGDGFGDGDAYSSEDNVGCTDKRKCTELSPLDWQRLSVYNREANSWEWISGKFPGRTAGAVRTRWSTMQPQVN